MTNFQLYVGGTNNITYRYEVVKAGNVFSVRIFDALSKGHKQIGVKSLSNVSAHDVIDECTSHYRRNAEGFRNFIKSLVKRAR
ncbi:hypothetical protein [Enterobacter hormaechei]|uniref:hypothetical protein n=1 Tax=Enterobacter hormaechei TaxID=158836 RepID=UPI00073541B4|nr:hypothetical protein [Enterobacter hormaechei]KTI09854.1 hypothetical protein ASV12_25295 [Enterobacter hormaechei subsp. xiangfangensis]KTI92960.1 hypothetical protein ASU94_09740 [Enterobacter hormaechei subsp. xiangfangensis]HAS1739587.1 hypothetical protein [Enterobacter hormaechei subsp. oharae]HAS1749757.1 hypothetical protein [Enterobacter hormaechei subsp. oharae]